MPGITPMKAIRKKCLECCCGSTNEVDLCTVKECPLYVYRYGKRSKVHEVSKDEE